MTVALLGEALGVLRTRDLGSLVYSAQMDLGTGGAELNVAIGLARLGADATWIGRLGDDGFGRRVLRDLRGEGVVVRTHIDPDAPTGLLVKERPYAGATRVDYHRAGSAGSRLSTSDLEGLDFESFDLLHVTGITAGISNSALDTVRLAVERATAAGVPISFDVNHRTRVWRSVDPSPVYRWIAERATIVFAGETEAALIAPTESAAGPAALAEAIAGLGPSEVVVKLGESGALVFADSAVTEAPAIHVDVVDTVGAGDAFVAGYLAERLLGAPIPARLLLATASGAAACTHLGDWEGMMSRAGLQAMLEMKDPVTR